MTSYSVTVTRRPPVQAVEAAAHSGSRRRIGEGVALFTGSAVLYLVVGWTLVSHGVLMGDSISRVANAMYVLYSRDPHLPAVGFIWNPLPSLAVLPFLPFKGLFPALVELGFAGNIQSALMMAGTVTGVATCLRKLGVDRAPRLVLTACFGLHPMIVLYGSNGLSEAMLLFSLVLTISALISWMDDQRSSRLVLAGLGLGIAYLARYESVAPALAVSALVGFVTSRRSMGSRSTRWGLALNDVLLVSAPFTFTFVTWAAMAKILVGEWFPTFSSVYGNSSQVSGAQDWIRSATGDTPLGALGYLGAQMHGLAPFVFPLLIATAVLAARQRRWTALVAPLVLMPVLAFDDLTLLSGTSFGWLRFQITVIPLSVLLAGSVIAAASALRHRPVAHRGTVLLIAVLVGAALPVAAVTLTRAQSELAREESGMLRAAFLPDSASESERQQLHTYDLDRQIASDLGAMDLAEGDVLTDSMYAFPILLASERPTEFVITSDLDFQDAVEDPAAHGVHYMLILTEEQAPQDALRREWPTLYEDGAGIAVLEREWPAGTAAQWRLYRVL